jgi:hypothetical protein
MNHRRHASRGALEGSSRAAKIVRAGARSVGVALFITVIGVAPGTVGSAPAAETPLASYTTSGCPTSAPAWRIGYRLYFSGKQSEGAVVEPTTRAVIPEVLAQTRAFADEVGRTTGCAMTVKVDVSDVGATRWYSWPSDPIFPDDHGSFLLHGHDSVFYRFPAHLEEPFCADTQQGTDGGVGRVLAEASGTMSCLAGGVVGPDSTLLMAAWVQHLFGFYEPRQGWPGGGCKPGYDLHIPCDSGLLDEDYLTALLQGTLMTDAGTVGIQPDEWALQGTPRHPLIGPTPLTFTLTRDGVRLTAPPDLPAGLVRLRVSHPIGHNVHTEVLTAPAHFTPTRSGAGLWRFCASMAGTERYRAAEFCVVVSQSRGAAPRFHPDNGLPKVVRTRRDGNVVTIVADRPDAFRRYRLIAERGDAQRVAVGKLTEGNGGLYFKLRLSPGVWRVHATGFNTIGGPAISGLPWRLTIPKGAR